MSWRRQKSCYKLIETVIFFILHRDNIRPACPLKAQCYFLDLKLSKVKDFVLTLFLLGVTLKTSPWPGLPFQIKMAYLHNRMEQANIQHDFAINGCEKGLEMIFDLIEWHNWLDYTKFFPPWGILKCLGGNKQIRLIEQDLVHVSVCAFIAYLCMLGCVCSTALAMRECVSD